MRKMKALTVKMEPVTLFGKGRQNMTCYDIKCMELLVKYFFLADILFLGGHLRFGQIHFHLANMFYLGGCLRLVILNSCKYGI